MTNLILYAVIHIACGLTAIRMAYRNSQSVSVGEVAAYLILGPVTIFAAMISKRDTIR